MSSPVIPLVAAGIGAMAALGTTAVTGLLRLRSDRRDQWWSRAEWAMEKALSDDPLSRQVSAAVIDALLESSLAQAEESGMLEIVSGIAIGEVRRA